MDCSQAANVHVPTTSELFHELLEGVLHTDSRLWRTLSSLWFSPGRLTREFVAGRRAAYLPPFRLYLVVSVLFFLLASWSHVPADISRPEHGAAPSMPTLSQCNSISIEALAHYPGVDARIRHGCREVVRDNGASLARVALGTFSKAMFIFLPLVAVVNMLLYWRPRYRYAEHLLFFVHLHAFYFSMAILALGAIAIAHAWPAAAGAADTLQTLLGWAATCYTVLAVRQVFAKSWTGAVLKTLVLAFIYLLVFALTVAGVYAYALLQL